MAPIRTASLIALLLAAALVAPLGVSAQPADPSTVVLVLRHAEKAADQGSDPPLSAAGLRRARALVDAAAAAGVTAIYTSQYRRTRDTAAPLAEHLGLEITVAPITGSTLDDYPRLLAEEVRRAHRGGTVLIVNHSNTVPAIVEALGGAPVAALPEDAYGDLFVVVLPPQGAPRTIRARYGR